jgi:hypothetical protein
MSPASFLLRLLLAASLVTTTTGGALASMQMHLAQSATAHLVDGTAAAVDVAADEAPCHDTADAAPRASAGVPHDPAGHGDCCLGGDCDGICLLSLPPLPGAAWLAAAAPSSQAHRSESSPDRPAPRLTRPQRPPIA